MADISDEDRAIWAAAKEAQDLRTGKIRRPRPSSRNGGKIAQVSPETRAILKASKRNGRKTTPKVTKPKAASRPYLKTGLRLFYRDKHTGIIQFGTVTKVYHSGFDYAYDGKTVMLGFNVIGTRLFYSWNDAWQHYKKERDGET